MFRAKFRCFLAKVGSLVVVVVIVLKEANFARVFIEIFSEIKLCLPSAFSAGASTVVVGRESFVQVLVW